MKTQKKVKWALMCSWNKNDNENVLVHFLIKTNGKNEKLYFETDLWTKHLVDKGGKILKGIYIISFQNLHEQAKLFKSKLMVKAYAVAINIFEICGVFLPKITWNIFRVMLVKKIPPKTYQI